VDRAYRDALAAGATGGKLLGAGGGGFLLLHVPPAAVGDVRAALAPSGFTEYPCRFSAEGPQVTRF
jgi:D-glycero-alpha-D-manno-heptose-7-phosphate kinase